MHLVLKIMTKKLGGPIHCWSPQPKSWGGLVSPGPYGCCAYGQEKATNHRLNRRKN